MKEIINLGIYAHVDAGKTSLTEQLLWRSGAIRRPGSVDDGTAQTDFTDVERRRRISVRSSSTGFDYRDMRVNLIDTPGHMDFAAEVERALRVLDCAVIVVSAVEGVQSRTEIVWELLRERGLPVIFFINKLDRAGADFTAVCEQLSALTPDLLPLALPLNEESRDCSALSVLADPSLAGDAEAAAAEASEELTDRYLASSLTQEEVLEGLRLRVREGSLFPVYCGSAALSAGTDLLLDGIIDLFPRAGGDPDGPLSGVVYKLEHDRTMGRLTEVRLFSGRLKNRDVVDLGGMPQKITQIRRLYGSRFSDEGELAAGDIAALCGLGARLGDILGDPSLVPPDTRSTRPLLRVKAIPSSPDDFPRLTEAASELTLEDPLLAAEWVSEKKELTLNVTGTIQLEVLGELFRSRYGLDCSFGRPSVIFRETPAASGYGFDAYTMPKPCWAVLKFLIEPLPLGSGVEYSSIVENNKIFYRYQNQVEKTIPRALRQGPCGWEVSDLRITLVDGGHHTIHTHPLDFIVATPMALMNGLAAIGTLMVEPMLRFRLTLPEELGGKVMGDIINMRGSFEATSSRNGRLTLEGEYPVSTSMDFPGELARITGGRAVLSCRFSGYRHCDQRFCETTEYRGISPLDRAKYILWVRHAITDEDSTY